jgi:ERCC4-type nuclease
MNFKTLLPTVIIDTREPSPHPWERFAPDNITFIREGLETGDFCLRALPDGAVIERKTPQDLAGCLTSSRERFERELRRSRHCGAFTVVVEGNLSDVILAARGVSVNAVVGTLAAWSRRYCPFIFAGSIEQAANFSFRYLMGQIRDHDKAVVAIKNMNNSKPNIIPRIE